MELAQIGPLTAAFETVATAVGAGIVLGGFAFGTARHLAGWPRKALEARIVTDGYIGGVVGVLVILGDLILRYGP
jgi:hypothetical protein